MPQVINVPLSMEGRIEVLESFGFVVGKRDPKMNSDHEGAFMVAEEVPEGYAGQRDGSDNEEIWCVVGDDMELLVSDAIDLVTSFDPEVYEFVIETEGPAPS